MSGAFCCVQKRFWFRICWTIAIWWGWNDLQWTAENEERTIRSEYILKFIFLHLAKSMDLLWFVLIGYSGHDRLHPVGFGATSGACRSASCTFHYSSAQPVPTRMQTYAAHTLFDMNRTIQRRLAPDICTIFQEVIFLTVAYCIIMFDFIKNILIIHYRFIHEHFIKRWAERCK